MIELNSIRKPNNYIKAYAIEVGDKSLPTIKKAAVTADLRKVSQRNKESKLS
ncbi:hypothetical protein ACFLVZ_00895 [Chloroflexota bacterium]